MAWWTPDRLASSGEVFRPPGFVGLLGQLRTAGPPAEPIVIDA
ncbi:hypothetical protein [Amycolatopsis australiensis]|nr:hypothetical protein [Amycolatopsis australiensis]